MIWTVLKAWVSTHKKTVAIIGAVVLGVLLFGLGYGFGRYALPAKVVITEKVHEVEKIKLVEHTKTDVQIVKIHDQEQAQKIHRTIVEGIDPPGCRAKTTTEDINVDTVVHDNTEKTKVQYVDRTVEKWQDKIVEKEKLVLNQAGWMVHAGVGYSIPYALGQGSYGVPGLQGFVVQVGADRRIVGPIWFGVFGNTQGTLGVNLAGSW